MKKNMHIIDSMMRILFALVVVALYFMDYIKDTAAMVLGLIAVIMLLTGCIRFCPLYRMFGISSCARCAEKK